MKGFDFGRLPLCGQSARSRNSKAFIDLFPPFFAASDADKDWYEHLYILGDDHFSAQGNRMMFEELAKRLSN